MAIINPIKMNLKDGRAVTVKACEPDLATLFVAFTQQVAKETPYTRYSTGVKSEAQATAEQWQIDLSRPDHLHLGAYLGEKSTKQIGYLRFRQPYPDHWGFKHVADFGIMLLSEAWGQGLGRLMMNTMEEYAKSIGIHRIEARIRDGNLRGSSFFESLGYKVEGTRQHAVKSGDGFDSEHYIAKLI